MPKYIGTMRCPVCGKRVPEARRILCYPYKYLCTQKCSYDYLKEYPINVSHEHPLFNCAVGRCRYFKDEKCLRNMGYHEPFSCRSYIMKSYKKNRRIA